MANVLIQCAPDAVQFLSASFPALTKGGTNFPAVGLAYDATAAENAFWMFRAVNYASGNLTLGLDWYADTASSGDVVWSAAIAAITPDADTQDIETKAFATANTVTDTHLGTTGKRLHRCTITITNLDSLAAEDDVWLKIFRDAANGADTMTGDAVLAGATASYLST